MSLGRELLAAAVGGQAGGLRHWPEVEGPQAVPHPLALVVAERDRLPAELGHALGCSVETLLKAFDEKVNQFFVQSLQLDTFSAPCKGVFSQRVRIPPGNCRSSR